MVVAEFFNLLWLFRLFVSYLCLKFCCIMVHKNQYMKILRLLLYSMRNVRAIYNIIIDNDDSTQYMEDTFKNNIMFIYYKTQTLNIDEILINCQTINN